MNNVGINRRFLETDDEEEACRLLFNEYYKTVFNVVDRMLGNRSGLPVDADDITSETFTKAFNKRKEIQEPEKLLEWLITAAKNLMIDKMRRFRSQTRRLPIESFDSLYDSQEEAPFASTLTKTDTERAEANRYLVAQLLRLLQDRDREIIEFMIDGLTPKEIAAEIGSTPEAVQKRWERIRKWLEPVARNLEPLIDCIPEENDRKIMERYLDGQPLSAIVKAIGIPPSAVGQTVKRVIAQWKRTARQNPTDPVSALVKKDG